MIAPVDWWTAGTAESEASVLVWLGRAIGMTRMFTVDGVQFRERKSEPLRRALSPQGRGFKDYDVRFGSGEGMRIRATSSRFYPDLVGMRAPPMGRLIEQIVRPGMRVVYVGSGTGQGAAWIALCAGAAGGVVALEKDGESVRFARRRYPAANISFEIGDETELRGEVDGSFHGAIALNAGRGTIELWRIVGPGGWLLTGEAGASALRSHDAGVAPLASVVDHSGEPGRLVLFRKPEPPVEPPEGANPERTA